MKHLLLSIVVLAISCTAQETPSKFIAVDLDVKAFAEKINALDNEQILDVRTMDECKDGMIPDAKHIDWFGKDFESKTEYLDKSKPVMVYCAAGGRSAKALAKLLSLGFTEVYNLKGGFGAWSDSRLEIQK